VSFEELHGEPRIHQVHLDVVCGRPLTSEGAVPIQGIYHTVVGLVEMHLVLGYLECRHIIAAVHELLLLGYVLVVVS